MCHIQFWPHPEAIDSVVRKFSQGAEVTVTHHLVNQVGIRRTLKEIRVEEFPSVPTEEWEAAIARDLKGAGYAKKLIWRTDEGLAVKPYYRSEDLSGLVCLDVPPGEFPFRRGIRTTGDWRIREEIDAVTAKDASRAARAAIAAGAEEIAFTAVVVENAADLERLLTELAEIPLRFERADEALIRLLVERSRKPLRPAQISTGCDALVNVDFAAEVIRNLPPGFVPFTVYGDEFEEAGATAAEEIGLTLSAGVDFLAAMQEREVDVEQAAPAIEFDFSISWNYFFQIAKLRAFRMLWARAIESFGGKSVIAQARIAARTSRCDKTVYDPHVNILRATTEAMAAILGGAISVTIAAFDECYKTPDEASRRLARNTQLLLKHEAVMGRVADAGGGAYYLEALTDCLADEGWKVLQDVEARGGYRKAKLEGMVAQKLARSMAAREASIATRKHVLTGTNQYGNTTERALDRVDLERVSAHRRGARAYEELRLRTERHVAAGGKTPHVLLAQIGDARMRAARANFATNFFACAGFEITTKRFKDTAEIAAENADLIALCSSDAEYGTLTVELMSKMKALKRTTPVLIAGNPGNAGLLAAAGIAGCVHLRSDPVEILTVWQQRLGIKG